MAIVEKQYHRIAFDQREVGARVAVLETLIQRWTHDLERRGHEVPAARSGDFLS